MHRQAIEEAHRAFAVRLRRASQWLRNEAHVTWLPAEELERALGAVLRNGMEGASGSEFFLVSAATALRYDDR